MGNGNYNFCFDINDLNKTITNEINKAISPFISKLKIKTSLDSNNIIKNNVDHIPNIIREDEIINLNYITNKNEKDDKVKIEIQYLENDKINKKKYEVIPLEIPEGEEFSKIIINNYLLKNSNLSKEEKIKLALKYQIFTNDTSLFAEVELSEKVSKEMKSKIIGDKKNNRILIPRRFYDIHERYDRKYRIRETNLYNDNYVPLLGANFEEDVELNGEDENIMDFKEYEKTENLTTKKRKRSKGIKKKAKKETKVKEENISNSEKTINLDEKEKVMKIIRTQDFIKGNWDENNETKKIKEKYKKEYNLLIGLKDTKINDNVAITIIIIYFIYKEYHELLSELSRLIKKAKNFIRKETNTSYEEIVKQIGI